MLIFDATTKSLEFKLGGAAATNQAVFTSMWVDHTASAYTPGTQNGVSNNTTAVTIVTAPGASTQRSLKYLNIYNRDTAQITVTVQYNDNTTIREMLVVVLAVKDTLQYIDTEGWAVIDTNGQKKSIANVTVTAALPAGTNNIGDVDVLSIAAGDNNIGNVDIVTVPAPLSTTGGGTEATALRVTVANDSTGVLSVDDNNNSLTVDGTVTANAGTNLNTSALALETGGNLATVAGIVTSSRAAVNPIAGQAGITAGAGAVAANTPRTTLASDDPAVVALQVIDDWDESDRAKVNPIAGQAGVQGGSGTVTALTQRVVLATDVALPTGTNSIGSITDGGSGKTLKRAVVSLTASGTIVAAVASKVTKVYAFSVQSLNDSMTLQITDGSGGSALDQLWTLNTREGIMGSAVNPPSFLFKTTANTILYATITGTGTLKIAVSYWDDDAA